MAQRLNEDICYQCGVRIETVKEFSIEHKKPWLDSDPALFWDLDNIAFSHLKCNIGAARKTTKIHRPKGQCWCWRCETLKDESEFPATAKTKRNRECTSCNSALRAEYRERTGRR